jgi:hypothetical protein
VGVFAEVFCMVGAWFLIVISVKLKLETTG